MANKTMENKEPKPIHQQIIDLVGGEDKFREIAGLKRVNNKTMTKIKIWKTIFFHDMDEYPTWKDIKDIQFEDDDRIRISYEEPFYSENNSHDGGWVIEVEREMEETDEEYERRMSNKRMTDEILKKQRYESYIKLKKEFEDEKLN